MATTFPTALDSFPLNTDGVDIVTAADINNLQDAVSAIEAILAIGSATNQWTPGYGGSTTNPTVTYAARGGRYVRLGGMVWVTGYIALSAASGGSGSLIITGLPFACGAAEFQRGSFAVGFAFGFTSLAPVGILPNVSAATAVLIGYGAADARGDHSTGLTTANLSATSTIYFSGMYAATT